MFLTPQQTTVLKNVQYGKVNHALDLAKIGGGLEVLNHAPEGILAVLDKSSTKDIPPFNPPMPLRSGELAIDLRSYWSQISHAMELGKEITSGPARLLIDQAILQKAWMVEPSARTRMASLGELPLHTYSYWVAEGISRVITADVNTQREIVELAAWFYQCSFIEQLPNDEDFIYKVASKISRVSWGTIDPIIEMINQVGYLKDLSDLSNAIRNLQSVRTDKVNPGLIVTALAGSWFGSTSARETAAVALEYPPFFLAMLTRATTDALYRKSPIFDIAKRADKRGKFDEYHRAYMNLIRSIV